MFLKLIDVTNNGITVVNEECNFAPLVNDVVTYGASRYIVRSREYAIATDTLIVEARRLP